MRPDPYAWQLDLDAVVVVSLVAGGYALALRGCPVEGRRLGALAAGLGLVLVSHLSPLAAIANHYLLSAHLLQNVILAEWVPALVVWSLPPALAGRLAMLPGARLLTQPALALPIWALTYLLWHLPWPYDAALEHQSTLLHLEHACYFASGVLLWWPILQAQPHALGPGAKAVYLACAFVLASPLGLVLSLLSVPAYDFYAAGPGLWGLSPLADQQIGGVSMTVEEASLFAALGAYYLRSFLRAEEGADVLALPTRAPTSSSR